MKNKNSEIKYLNDLLIIQLNELCSAVEAQMEVSNVESILLRMKRHQARKLLDSLRQAKLYQSS